MADSILDYIGDNWQSLLGMSQAQASPSSPPPPQPPPQMMAGAPPSFAPNSAFDANTFADAGKPSWLPNTVGNLQQGGSPMLAGTPPPRFPTPAVPPTPQAPTAPTGDPMIRTASAAPVPPPTNPNAAPLTAPAGGLASSLGITPEVMQAYVRDQARQLDATGAERTKRDALRTSMEGLGKGLTAVGNLRPGATGAAAFAAGAGGSLTGTAEAQRTAQNDLFNQSSTAFKDILAADKEYRQADTDEKKLALSGRLADARIKYLDALSQMRASGAPGSNAWQNTPYGKALALEKMLDGLSNRRRLERDSAIKAGATPDELKAFDEETKKTMDSERGRRAKVLGINPNEYKRGTTKEDAFDFDTMNPQQRLMMPDGAFYKYKDPKTGKDVIKQRDWLVAPPYPGWQPQSAPAPATRQPTGQEVEANIGSEEAA